MLLKSYGLPTLSGSVIIMLLEFYRLLSEVGIF